VIVDRDSENTKLLEKILAAIEAGNKKLDQIVTNTTPAPSDDITKLGGSISPPIKK
jgi:hypothetical protein